MYCTITEGDFRMEQRLKQDIQIGQTIRALRLERNLTQEQVITKLQLMNIDITRSIYSQIESGTYNIRISVLIGLSRLFQVDYNTFFQNLSLPESEETTF